MSASPPIMAFHSAGIDSERGSTPGRRVLFITGREGYPCGFSGFDRLTTCFPFGAVCGYDRRPVPWARIARPVVRAIAGSSWALPETIWNELRVRRLLHREKFELIHVLWGERDFGIIDHIAERLKVPLVVTFHAPYHTQLHPLRRTSALQRISGATLVSETQRAFLSLALRKGVPVRSILHGIDTNAFYPVAGVNPYQGFVVCFVGSFRRDFDVLERVISRFTGDHEIKFRLLAPIARQIRKVS